VKINLTFLTLLCFLLSFNFLYAQNEILNQKRGRLYTTEGYEIKFKSLKENKSVLVYTKKGGKISAINKDEVLRIEAQTGNEALRWGTVSFGATLLGNVIGLIGANQNAKDMGGTINKKQLYLVGASTTVFFTSLGILFGASKKKYKTIFENPSFSSKLKNWNINATSIHNKPALGLTIHF